MGHSIKSQTDKIQYKQNNYQLISNYNYIYDYYLQRENENKVFKLVRTTNSLKYKIHGFFFNFQHIYWVVIEASLSLSL